MSSTLRADNELVSFFFNLQSQIRVYHWQTNIYSRHKATNNLLEKLDPLMDSFMEIFQGKYGKLKIEPSKPIQTSSGQLTDDQAILFLQSAIDFLSKLEVIGVVKSTDTDLLNIRDELVGQLNQTLYLFSFM
jgi:hypothetical protein